MVSICYFSVFWLSKFLHKKCCIYNNIRFYILCVAQKIPLTIYIYTAFFVFQKISTSKFCDISKSLHKKSCVYNIIRFYILCVTQKTHLTIYIYTTFFVYAHISETHESHPHCDVVF